MADIGQVKLNRFQAAENKRYNFEMKKLRTKHNKQLSKEMKTNEAVIERMRGEYEVKVGNLKNELEQKLAELRLKQKEQLKIENERLSQEVSNLKLSHQDKVGELKSTNENQINDIKESHKKSLEIARQKYVKEKTKYEVES